MHQQNRRPYRPRAVLSQAEVIKIFKNRKQSAASELASLFKISPKTVRDIWNRRTWIHETKPLWSVGEKPKLRVKKIKSDRHRQVVASDVYSCNGHISQKDIVCLDTRETLLKSCLEQKMLDRVVQGQENSYQPDYFPNDHFQYTISPVGNFALMAFSRAPNIYSSSSSATACEPDRILGSLAGLSPTASPPPQIEQASPPAVAAAPRAAALEEEGEKAWASAGVCDTEDDPFRRDWPYW